MAVKKNKKFCVIYRIEGQTLIVRLMTTISSQCYISIPPENRKPQSFIIFSGGIEV